MRKCITNIFFWSAINCNFEVDQQWSTMSCNEVIIYGLLLMYVKSCSKNFSKLPLKSKFDSNFSKGSKFVSFLSSKRGKINNFLLLVNAFFFFCYCSFSCWMCFFVAFLFGNFVKFLTFFLRGTSLFFLRFLDEEISFIFLFVPLFLVFL